LGEKPKEIKKNKVWRSGVISEEEPRCPYEITVILHFG
jgi:hypothetical protein